MPVTMSDIAEEVADQVGEDFTIPVVKTDFLQQARDAIEEILLAANWPFANKTDEFTTEVGTTNYQVGTDVAEVRVLFLNDDDIPLRFTTVDEIRRKAWDKDLLARPSHWYVDTMSPDGQVIIGLYPNPDAEYTITAYGTGRADTDLLANPETTVPVPPDVHPLVRMLMRMSFYLRANNFEAYDRMEARYEKVMRKVWSRYMDPIGAHYVFEYSRFGGMSQQHGVPQTIYCP